MKLTAEKIEILRELYFESQIKAILKMKTGIEWNRLSKLLKWLNDNELIKSIDEYRPAKWQITSAGIDAIKKWDLGGIPGKLFKEAKG